jgi:hypothetical protein
MTYTITRVANGWVLDQPSFEVDDDTDEMEETNKTFVFEDNDSQSQPEAHSLQNLLWEAFPSQFQSKWQGGLVVEVREQGREQEVEDEGEEEDDYEEWEGDEYED